MSVSTVSLAAPPHRSVASFAPPRRGTRPLSPARRTNNARRRRASIALASQKRAFMDLEIEGQPAGRLTFNLRPDLCPKTVANFLALCTGANAGVDPKLTYKGCSFEPYSGKYTYTCKGNGKHVYGGVGKFVERDAMSATRNGTPGAGGGVYYGEPVDLTEDERSVVLVVPISGPGFGSSRFAVVRVGESPGSLKQRLLTNTMVIGRCVDETSWETLRLMTVADGGAKIVDCGEC